MRSRSTRPTRPALAVAAALAVPALALGACGTSGSGGSSPSASGSSSTSSSSAPTATTQPAAAPNLSPAAKGDIPGVTVGGTKDKPTITIAKPPLSTQETTVKVLTEGTGEPVKLTDTVVVNVALAGGKSGKTLDDTFARKAPDEWNLKQVLPGLTRAVVGQKAGSRVLTAIAPADAAAIVAKNNPQAGIAADETVVAVIDIVKIGILGEPCKFVTSKEGLPEVTVAEGKPATMTPVKTAPPKVSTAYVLKQGTGPVVQAGQTLSSQYTGMLWTDGKKFDSSYDHGGKPADFGIGVKQVIKAWDKCLVGQKVGTQLMIVAPPAEAYGPQGNPPTIPANSTLVFVVDIVGAK